MGLTCDGDFGSTMVHLPDKDRMSLLDCNCTVIRRASRHLSRLYDLEFAPIGLKTTQVVILALVGQGGCRSIPELADALAMDRSTAGHNLRPLRKAGLVEVGAGPLDLRTRTVQLTDAGHKRLASGQLIWKTAQAKFHAEFGADEAAQMRTMMGRVATLKME